MDPVTLMEDGFLGDGSPVGWSDQHSLPGKWPPPVQIFLEKTAIFLQYELAPWPLAAWRAGAPVLFRECGS